jgi:hypothetical protein
VQSPIFLHESTPGSTTNIKTTGAQSPGVVRGDFNLTQTTTPEKKK